MQSASLTHLLAAARLCCVVVGGLCCSAAAFAEDSRWQFTAEIYALAAGVEATTDDGETVSKDFEDILDDLDIAAFGSFAARNGRLLLFGNTFYVDQKIEQKSQRGRFETELQLDAQNLVSTFGAGWALVDFDWSQVYLVGGARYLGLDTSLSVRVNEVSTRRDSNSDVWDGVVGLQGRTDISERWYLNYYADVGTGDSDVTWQFIGGVNYRYSSFDLTLGYQYVNWDFEGGSKYKDLQMAGPSIGVKFQF